MRAYGLQLYSVRDFTKDDLLGTIGKVAQMGYRGMEFAGFFGCAAEDVKKTMDACGVTAWGTHTGADALREDTIDATVAYHKAIACDRLIIPGHDLRTLEKLKDFAALIRSAGPRLADNGITLAYHNHSHEFYPNEDGVVIYDWLLENTDIALQLDTFWAFNAGKDPLKLLAELGKRIICVHLKDGIKDGPGYSLGLGEAPVRAVHDYCAARDIPMVVESENLDPDGLSEVRRCIEYLRSIQ